MGLRGLNTLGSLRYRGDDFGIPIASQDGNNLGLEEFDNCDNEDIIQRGDIDLEAMDNEVKEDESDL